MCRRRTRNRLGVQCTQGTAARRHADGPHEFYQYGATWLCPWLSLAALDCTQRRHKARNAAQVAPSPVRTCMMTPTSSRPSSSCDHQPSHRSKRPSAPRGASGPAPDAASGAADATPVTPAAAPVVAVAVAAAVQLAAAVGAVAAGRASAGATPAPSPVWRPGKWLLTAYL